MTYSDVITYAVSAFGLGLTLGITFGLVLRIMRSLGYN